MPLTSKITAIVIRIIGVGIDGEFSLFFIFVCILVSIFFVEEYDMRSINLDLIELIFIIVSIMGSFI